MGIVFDFATTDMMYSMDVKIQDSVLQSPKIPNPNIYVIGIDEETLREIGAWNNWNRGTMADMIDVLTNCKENAPAVIGIDISYFSQTQPEFDQKLANSAKKAGNVVVACEAIFNDEVKYDENKNPYIKKMQISAVDYPYDGLRNATTQGIINTLPEQDGVIRNSIFKIEHQDKEINSFSYEIYRKYAIHHNLPTDVSPPLDRYNRFPISYSGVAGDYYSEMSFVKVLREEIPPEIFADSIVLIGPYATGMMDQYYTPIEKGLLMYGVEIHANILQALIEQNFKQNIPVYIQTLFLFVVLFVLYIIFSIADPRVSTLLVVLVAFLYVAFSIFIYSIGYIVNIIYLPIFVFALYLYRMIYSYFSERMQRQMVTETFKRYMEPSVVEHLLKNSDARSNMSGTKRDIAVLFVDIRGFTPMSEVMDTSDVVLMLNEYLTLTSSSIFSNQGTLDKFIGDATMAIFNAPLDLDDYTYKAVKTAVMMVSKSEELGRKLLEKHAKTVSFGIGVNCGEAIVGNIGAEFRMDYTAIGDTVNTAARLESKAKAGQILISEEVYKRLKGRIDVTLIGTMELKGKQNVITAYQVDGIIE